jgi:RNA polymerase sigma-70 factor (ECF subfamily)
VLAEDDGVLVDRARRGDAAAFETLVRRHDRAVLGLALRLTRSREEARDVYQETFLRAFQALPVFRQESAFRTWLLRIAANLCLDRLRRADAPPPEPVAGGVRGDGPGDRPDTGPDGDPERAAAGAEIRRRVAAALGALAPRERLVFELRHAQGERLAEVARVLGTTEETARNCLYRAHLRLREALADLAPGRGRVAARGGGRAATGRGAERAAGGGLETE